MPDPQQTQTPDFIPQPPASTQDTPDFIPAIPAMMPQSASTPDFIPADPNAKPSDGTGWLQKIKDGVSNFTTQDFQKLSRRALIQSFAGPLSMAATSIPGVTDAIESHIEQTPDAGITTGKGAWNTTSSVANVPLAGTFHRKGSGPIEGETEDWITGQLNPLNVGLAVASMGSSVAESVLVKAGLSVPKAAGLVKLGKIGADLGFLSKFGYDTYTKAIPEVERDWNDYNAEDNPKKKAALLDKLERHGTDIVLGSLAMGLATRGVEHDIGEYRAGTPKAKAVSNVEYGNGIYDYQAANQVGSGQAAQKYRELMKAVPDDVRRAGITHNIEANGNANTLRQWMDTASPETKPEIEAALNLTDKERAVRDQLVNILNGWKEALGSKNLLAPDGGRDNYMPHRPVFEDTDPVTGEPIQKTAADGERDFLKKRLYDSHASGEANGIKYATKDAVKLVSDYIERASNAIAKNDLGESLANGNMNDAAPMAVSGGYLGHPADVPLSALEIQQLQASGKFADLLAKGRIYEVPGTAANAEAAQPNAPAPRPATPAGAPTTPDFIAHEPAQLPAPKPEARTPRITPLPEGAEQFEAANVPEGKDTRDAYDPGTPLHDERVAYRERIKNEFINKATPVPEGEQPVAYILGGGTASGKTTAQDALLHDHPNSVVVDADAIKNRLPEYREWKKTDPNGAAYRVHEEASAISKELKKQASEQRKNIIIDATTSGTGHSSVIQDLKDKGYKVVLNFIDIPTDVAIAREAERFKNSLNENNRGRKTPPAVLEATHKGSAGAFSQLKDLADEAHLWDNTGKGLTKVYERVGDSPEKVYNEGRYDEYERKGNGQETRVGDDTPRGRELRALIQEQERVRAGAASDSGVQSTPRGRTESEGQELTRRPNWTQAPKEAAGRRAIPAEQKNYRWKFSDYRDSGLRVNRPAGQPEPITDALAPHPDTNSFPGEAILRQNQGGIPTDPKTGQPMVRVPVFANPELTPHLNAVLESTAPKSALMRGLLKFSSGAKSVLLSLSPFHWTTMMSRMLEANPTPSGVASIGRNLKNSLTMPSPVDYYHLTPKQEFAIQSGVVAGNTRPGSMDYVSEGNVAGHESLATKIPLIGRFNHWVESRLFGPLGFITGLKFDLHDRLTNEIQKSMPNLSHEDAGRISASSVNNKFGGLNYTVMGRSASTQNALRAALLAPDFLESTGRSVLDVAGKYGTPLVKSLVAFNVLHYLAARAVNYLVSGNYHPESGYSVISKDGKREYGIRTTVGDFLHFAEHPRDFMMNRVNPLLVRTPLELLGGVDAQGNKVGDTQKMWDTARQVLPIPIQTLTPKQQISQPSGMDEALKAVGVQSKKRFSPAETLAYQRATQKNQGAPLEGDALEKAQTKFRLADSMRDAVVAKDANARKAAADKINQARKAGQVSVDEQQQMTKDAYTYPTRLTQTVAHLPLEDSLDVYAAASQQEKKEIRRAVASKIESYYSLVERGKKSSADYKAIQPRIQKFFQDKP